MKICLVCGETYPKGRYQEHLVQRDHPYHAGDWDSQARNEQIIELLGEGFTYQEVADELGLTRARIGQIANRYDIYVVGCAIMSDL